MFLQVGLFVLLYLESAKLWVTESNRKLEEMLMKSYNRKHRPVKKDSTTMQIQIYLLIGHIEKVDEYEQTMLMHGLLWASWTDEYLQWDPSKYNNTKRIAIESWKIWQPALSLYNSARGNSWYLHMGGLPASVNNEGKVWASGSFSFHVTCLFDFTNYPYDEQECPIVIADWIYDLSKVNLSDPAGNTALNKPAIKLSYDPLNSASTKKHAAGWEVKDTWRRQCYWGPAGCKDEAPDSQPEWFWSLIEFGIRIKRNAPYFGLTVILPTLVTCMLTMVAFWIDTISLAIAITVMNILLQGLFSWELIRNLPPGSGGIPKIVLLYGLNLSLTAIAFMLHVIITYFIYILPDNMELPFKLTDVTEWLKQLRPFKVKGFSFDPQKILTGDHQDEQLQQQQLNNIMDIDQNPTFRFTTPTELGTNSTITSDENIALTENTNNKDTTKNDMALQNENIIVNKTIRKGSQNSEIANELGHIAQQLYIFRRLIFFAIAIIYIIILPICLI